MPAPLCPHCLLPLVVQGAGPYPSAALRCPHCRLIVGAGRAKLASDQAADPRSRGSAAGVVANAARRAQGEPQDPEEVVIALRTASDRVGIVVDRLRMLDYQTAAAEEPVLPPLAAVLSTYGTWKEARQAASDARRAGVRDAEGELDGADPVAS